MRFNIRRYFARFVIFAFGVLIFLYITGYQSLIPGYHALFYSKSKYRNSLAQIAKKRQNIRKEHPATHTNLGSKLLEEALTKRIFPYWYGTIWGYNGMTETPGQGRIACGYFVTTVLRDAGFQINYRYLAQIPSEKMINSLVQKKHITHINQTSIRNFVSIMRGKGNGIYLVGLDTHTGFLLVKDQKVHFVHSSGRLPFCVLKEDALKSTTLVEPKYKVCGKLSADTQLLGKWIKGEKI